MDDLVLLAKIALADVEAAKKVLMQIIARTEQVLPAKNVELTEWERGCIESPEWEEFETFRNQIKRPFMTIESKRRFMKRLYKLSAPGHSKEIAVKILQQSIDNRWQGIFPLKEYT